jgi:hypothetical protein
MTMQIKLKAASLNEALSIVSIVDPRPVAGQQNSAVYLFHCFNNPEQDGKPWCHLYSCNEQQTARAGFELDEMDEEGDFTFQVQPIQIWRDYPEDVLTIKAVSAQGENQASIAVTSTSGNDYDHLAFDPRRVIRGDKEYADAVKNGKVEFNVGVLREALSLSQSFLPKNSDKATQEHLNTVQIFDKSKPEWEPGNGHMFCADGFRVFDFSTNLFEDKGFTLHSAHLGKLGNFLGKCSGQVAIYKTKNKAFVVNGEKDQLFGWNHEVKTHERYGTYPTSLDKWVFRIERGTLLKAISATALALDNKNDQRVRLVYSHERGLLHIAAHESSGKFKSLSVICNEPHGVDHFAKDFEFNVELGNFRSIIQDIKSPEVELRISPMPPPRTGVMLRTFEDLILDANGKVFSVSDKSEGEAGVKYKCQVTRFMTSMA